MAKSVAYANLVLDNRLPYDSASSLQTRMYQMGKRSMDSMHKSYVR